MNAWAILAAAALALPAEAQVVCRPGALGTEVCSGVPNAQPRLEPFTPRRRGLAAVQPPVEPARPALAGAGRTDALGNTFLRESDLPPGRPPLPGLAPAPKCGRDALGNLACR